MNYRFSGHESFPCRYTWLPKAFQAIQDDAKIFTDDEKAMVKLGVGKNMVRAIRFWVQVAGVAESSKSEYAITRFGEAIFSRNGLDPFLEDIRTLWLIHWNFSTHVDDPLFAWDFLLNSWQHPEISRSEVLRAFQKEAERNGRNLSSVTLEQHFEIFLHTYIPTRSPKGEILEDNLDSPLVELELIQAVGERKLDSGKREVIYAFRRDEKPEITPEVFHYCLNDYWDKRRANEKTLSFRDVSVSLGSPGQIFKLNEWDLRERLELVEKESKGAFVYKESAGTQRITRGDLSQIELLARIYASKDVRI